EEELVQVDTTAKIVLTNAMDNHSFIAQILADRAAELCDDPAKETVVIVGHGEFEEGYFEGWVNSSKSLAEKIKLILRHSKGINIEDVTYSFIYQPEDYPVNLTVRAVVENVSAASYPLVIPLMISEGFFTDRYIPYMLLAGLDYAYPGKGKRALTPHDNVANWIEVTAFKELTYPAVLIYDEEELQEISLEEVGAHHGEICPCVAVAFRSTLRAFSEEELWGGIPHRGDVKIISAHPSDGHKETFEYILNSSEAVIIQPPEGTDIINITADNYVYTFINKSTGDSITLRVKEEIFPERFFELRTKNKLGTAKPEEKKAFKLLGEELKEKAMYLPMDRVFEECPPGVTSIDVEKTVWDQATEAWVDEITAPLGETVTFNSTVHNDGECCNLRNITVMDTLSDSLKYMSATPEPDEVIKNPDGTTTLMWKISGELAPRESLTFLINATLIKTGEGINVQNATAWCGETMVADEDTATVHSVRPEGGIGVAVLPRLSPVSGSTVNLSIKVVNKENFGDIIQVNLTNETLPEVWRADLSWFNWTSTCVRIPAGGEVVIPLRAGIPDDVAPSYKAFRAVAKSTTWIPTAFDTGIFNIT
ncbi:MAG: hypothetical protein WAV32_09115, partial [Halobacteriota archaeon]